MPCNEPAEHAEATDMLGNESAEHAWKAFLSRFRKAVKEKEKEKTETEPAQPWEAIYQVGDHGEERVATELLVTGDSQFGTHVRLAIRGGAKPVYIQMTVGAARVLIERIMVAGAISITQTEEDVESLLLIKALEGQRDRLIEALTEFGERDAAIEGKLSRVQALLDKLQGVAD